MKYLVIISYASKAWKILENCQSGMVYVVFCVLRFIVEIHVYAGQTNIKYSENLNLETKRN